MDEMEAVPPFFGIDLVAHCGHSLAGEHAWTLTATDVFTGWTLNVAIRNRAHTHVVAAIEQVDDRLPYPIVGLDCDYADVGTLVTTVVSSSIAPWSGGARSARS